ncbi:MAG: hypothetical protein J6S91_06770 [Treponema sp.]|nr:hypothetical protein [Treponema sp.]
MFQNKSKKRDLYYDHVIRLYYEEGLGNKKISHIIPVNPSTVTTWIRNFANEHPEKIKMRRKHSNFHHADASSDLPNDVKALKAEISRLQKELAHESLRADAYDEMINVAEKRFNIPIRKKAGAKQ